MKRAKPNRDAFERHVPKSETDAIFLYTRDRPSAESSADFSARMFAPWDGVAEDPATGSATGAAAALILTRERRPDGLARLVFSQGVDMGRPSRLNVAIEMAGGEAKQVRVGGLCADIMSGEIKL